VRVDVVGIKKVKRPIGSGRWRAYAVGEDAHGRWFYTPPGSAYLGWDGLRTVEWEVGRGNRDTCPPVLQLIPNAGWWTACWYGRDGYVPGQAGDPLPSIAVDVCTPPVFVEGEWTYTDLELDPLKNEEGVVWIDDEDEFAAACDARLIPPDEQREARRTADEIVSVLQTSEEPFGKAGWDHLDRAIGVGLAPLRSVL
jgi:hypothetical protein